MAADLIFAEANEAQDVKEPIQALMIREEEDAANSPTIQFKSQFRISSYKRIDQVRGLVTYAQLEAQFQMLCCFKQGWTDFFVDSMIGGLHLGLFKFLIDAY